MSKYERISCHHFVERNGYAYFSNWFYNGLFQVELKTGKTMFLGTFINERQDELNIHWELLLQGDLIYFFPRRGRHIHVYSLADGTHSAVETRKVSEAFFPIGEVVIDSPNIFLLPKEGSIPVRRFDLNTWDMAIDTTDAYNTRNGIWLSQSHEVFPDTLLLERYQIEKADKFSWMHMPDGRWCAFLPMGRQLLWYAPQTQEIKAVPLTVINEEELEAYLQPLRRACLHQKQVLENSSLTFCEYLKTIVLQTDDEKTQNENNFDFTIGDNIWKYLKS